MNTYILLMIGAAALLEGVAPTSKEIDDRLNFIEPTSDNWLVPNKDNKVKSGKSPYYSNKPAYQSYELQFKTGKKKSPLNQLQWTRPQQPEEGSPPNQDSLPAVENTKERITGAAGETPQLEYTMPQSLHNHENKHKYHHSIMGGWII